MKICFCFNTVSSKTLAHNIVESPHQSIDDIWPDMEANKKPRNSGNIFQKADDGIMEVGDINHNIANVKIDKFEKSVKINRKIKPPNKPIQIVNNEYEIKATNKYDTQNVPEVLDKKTKIPKSYFSTNNFSEVSNTQNEFPQAINLSRQKQSAATTEYNDDTSSSESEIELIAKPPPAKKTITFNIKLAPPLPDEPEDQKPREPKIKKPKKKKSPPPLNSLERVALLLKKRRKEVNKDAELEKVRA